MENNLVQENNKMTRGEFLKKTVIGAAAAAVALKFGGGAMEALASTPSETKAEQYVGAVPPADKNITWIDTSVGGVLKFWDGAKWSPVKSTWG